MKGHHIDPKTDPEVYKQMAIRYEAFKNSLDKPETTPVPVFNPLPKALTDQLLMLRELSKGLQAKKDEDIRKQQQSAEEMSAEAEQEVSSEEKSSEKEDQPEAETAAA